jgi:hypothetical protein
MRVALTAISLPAHMVTKIPFWVRAPVQRKGKGAIFAGTTNQGALSLACRYVTRPTNRVWSPRAWQACVWPQSPHRCPWVVGRYPRARNLCASHHRCSRRNGFFASVAPGQAAQAGTFGHEQMLAQGCVDPTETTQSGMEPVVTYEAFYFRCNRGYAGREGPTRRRDRAASAGAN